MEPSGRVPPPTSSSRWKINGQAPSTAKKNEKWSASWSALAENVVSETCKGNWAGRYSQQLRSHLASEPSNQRGLPRRKSDSSVPLES